MNHTMDIASIFHLLQLSDSAFPIGAFAFSNTLESASEQNIVNDSASLEAYTREIVRSSAFTDGVAALVALQATIENRYEAIATADKLLFCSKAGDEARRMTQRMGLKLTEIMVPMLRNELLDGWHDDISHARAAGTFAVSLGIVAALCHIPREALYGSVCYGAASVVLGAALRSTRTTHLTTQLILFKLGPLIEELYAEAALLDIEQMNSFAPQYDIMASLHEKGSKRLFMN